MAESPALMQVVLAWSPGPRQVVEHALTLPAGLTVAEVLARPEVQALHPPGGTSPGDSIATGLWGRKVATNEVVRDGDRLELYRPLRVDPKVARRERFARQGSRAAGLFSQRRPGAKPGY